MVTDQFGTRLRELRKQADLSQRELAKQVGVSFTYLSKIESGAMPPPSEKVILKLAGVLNTDKDELLTLAGKIPSDIAQILKNREAVRLLRTRHSPKKSRSSNRKEGISMTQNSVNYKRLSRIVMAAVLVVAIGATLWFISPVADTAAATNAQGVVYNNEGEYDKAEVAFTKAIELDPNFALAYGNRSWVYINLGQYEQVIADSTKAIELDPSFALAYNNRAWAYIELGQYEQAIADYDKAIELDPSLQK